MAQTKIKAAQFSGVIGNGANGYILQSSGNGDMEWVANVTDPTVLSVTYPGDDTAADPAGGQTVTITGTGFQTGANVTIGGTAATSVSFVSETTLTITTPAKAAGDYDIVVTNTDTGTGTKINAISYNGVPAWTTAAGSLGTFASGETISTITLQASEPDAGTITFDIISGTLPTGLSLTGANINGTTSLETADTLYNFTIEAIDDENQATPRAFSITVTKQFIDIENFTINTYTGTGSTLAVEGKIGTAAAFNGSSSRIDVSNVFDFPTGNNPRSISLWVYNQSTVNAGIIGYGNNATGEAFYLYLDAQGKLGVYGYLYNYNSNYTLPTNQWVHLVITHDGTTTTVYANGTEQFNLARTFNTGTNSFRIGGVQWNNSSEFFNGKIDQVRIFNKALSSSEITTLYGEPSNPSTASTTDIFNDGSGVALYEFEKGAKDTGGVSGYIGSGAIFNGSSSGIVSTSFGISGNQARSYSTWVYTDGNTTGTICGVGDHGTAGQSMYFWIDQTNGGRWSVWGFTATYDLEYQALSAIANLSNGWHHFVLTWDASQTFNVYIDGSLADTETKAVTYNTPAIFAIGRWYDSGYWFNSKIDQVRVFNKAISSSEVTTLYGETSASSTKSTKDIFNDGSGVALYELEGNANDTGIGAIDSGQSADFNGSSSYIQNTSIDTATTKAVSLWVNADDFSERWAFQQGDGQGIENYIRFYNTDDIQVRWGNVTQTFSGYSANTWYHIVAQTDASGNANVWINGTEVGTSTAPTALTVDFTNIGVRKNGSTYQYYFKGRVDDVRIYSDTLTDAEIGYLYNNTTASIPTDNLTAYYKLDGNANDETGSYNGTATSITYSDPAEFPKYDGTATNVLYAYDGTPTNVGFVGTSFQPDLVWIKARTSPYSHNLQDSVRGGGQSTALNPNLTLAEGTYGIYGFIDTFDTNGFTVTTGSTGAEHTNSNGVDYVAWGWKAGGAAVSNTDGTITSTVSANPAAGLSIVKWTSDGFAGIKTIGHGLSSAPELILAKNIDISDNWFVYSATLGNNLFLRLNTTDSQLTGTNYWSTSATTFGVRQSSFLANGNEGIAYCFHSIDGYQKVGSYTGTGTTGNSIATGFQPRFLIIKSSSNAEPWFILDSIRDASNPRDNRLMADSDAAETDGSVHTVDFTSTGFTANGTLGNGTNGSGVTYIYLAIA